MSNFQGEKSDWTAEVKCPLRRLIDEATPEEPARARQGSFLKGGIFTEPRQE